MPDYAKGKVYKITNGDLTYIGSTTSPLSQRLAKHRYDKRSFDIGKKQFITSFLLLQDDNAIITLLEDVKCERKEQLLARERFYIENNICVNKHIPLQSKAEYRYKYRDELRIKHKQFREENKDKIKEQKKQYRAENAEKIHLKDKLYTDLNKEKKKEYDKQYREQHKDHKKEIDKQYRETHKEEIKKRKKQYYDAKKLIPKGK